MIERRLYPYYDEFLPLVESAFVYYHRTVLAIMSVALLLIEFAVEFDRWASVYKLYYVYARESETKQEEE